MSDEPGIKDRIADLEDRLRESEAARAKLREALGNFLAYERDCDQCAVCDEPPGACGCGVTELRAALAADAGNDPEATR